jgi:proteic killer suppression protein
LHVTFANKGLEKCYQQAQVRVKRWGKSVARRYVNRVDILYASTSAQDLYALPQLRLHPLAGDREGEYAMNLGHKWRLIVTFSDREMTVVRVEEVSDHYGD